MENDKVEFPPPSKGYRPRCFFDIQINKVDSGRVTFELLADICPKTCENFRALCTGEKGEGKTTLKPLHYKNSFFHRIVKGFIIQGGDFSVGNGTGGESIYGGTFKDENFELLHDRPFLLSMANRGPHTNGSQFFITLDPAPHLNNIHTVFGHVIFGHDIIRDVESQKVNDDHKPYAEVKISHCGELVKKSKSSVKKTEIKKTQKKYSSSDSSSSSSESETEKEDKKKKKKKEKRSNENENEKENVPDTNGTENNDLNYIPSVPSSFLLRRSRTPSPIQNKRKSEGQSRRPGFQPPLLRQRVNMVSKSGKKLRGRGVMRYRTPTPDSDISDAENNGRSSGSNRLQEQDVRNIRQRSRSPNVRTNFGRNRRSRSRSLNARRKINRSRSAERRRRNSRERFRRRSKSPKRRSRSPKRVSRSPRHSKSRSPRRHSRSPRRRSRSRSRNRRMRSRSRDRHRQRRSTSRSRKRTRSRSRQRNSQQDTEIKGKFDRHRSESGSGSDSSVERRKKSMKHGNTKKIEASVTDNKRKHIENPIPSPAKEPSNTETFIKKSDENNEKETSIDDGNNIDQDTYIRDVLLDEPMALENDSLLENNEISNGPSVLEETKTTSDPFKSRPNIFEQIKESILDDQTKSSIDLFPTGISKEAVVPDNSTQQEDEFIVNTLLEEEPTENLQRKRSVSLEPPKSKKGSKKEKRDKEIIMEDEDIYSDLNIVSNAFDNILKEGSDTEKKPLKEIVKVSNTEKENKRSTKNSENLQTLKESNKKKDQKQIKKSSKKTREPSDDDTEHSSNETDNESEQEEKKKKKRKHKSHRKSSSEEDSEDERPKAKGNKSKKTARKSKRTRNKSYSDSNTDEDSDDSMIEADRDRKRSNTKKTKRSKRSDNEKSKKKRSNKKRDYSSDSESEYSDDVKRKPSKGKTKRKKRTYSDSLSEESSSEDYKSKRKSKVKKSKRKRKYSSQTSASD